MRGRFSAGGLNPVSIIPSGWKMSRCDILIERQPADPRHDVAEQEEVDVAVDEALARRGGRALRRARARSPSRSPARGRRDRHRACRPGDVRQQVPDGDGALAVAIEPGDVRSRQDRSGARVPARSAASPPSSWRRPWSARRGRRWCRSSSASAPAPPRAARTPFRTGRRRPGRRARRRPASALAAIASSTSAIDAGKGRGGGLAEVQQAGTVRGWHRCRCRDERRLSCAGATARPLHRVTS